MYKKTFHGRTIFGRSPSLAAREQVSVRSYTNYNQTKAKLLIPCPYTAHGEGGLKWDLVNPASCPHAGG